MKKLLIVLAACVVAVVIVGLVPEKKYQIAI